MIHVTGDIHGAVFERFTPEAMPGEDRWGAEDKLIVLGDFGLVFYPDGEQFRYERLLEQKKLEYLEAKPYEILFIDGNHENFDRLFAETTEEERYGGTVRRVGRNVFWLQRGQIYTIEGRTFFCMGGAYSIDKDFRKEGISWWARESPTEKEMENASENLIAAGRKADYILTHNCPQVFIQLMGYVANPNDIALTSFFNWIWYEIEFGHWYFGHWHIDRDLHPKVTALYESVRTLGEE